MVLADIDVAADIISAIAVLIAGAGLWLALKVRGDATKAMAVAEEANDLSQRANELAQAAQVLSIRPVVVGCSGGTYDPGGFGPDAAHFHLPLRNVGSGTALIERVTLGATGDRDIDEILLMVELADHNLLPGESAKYDCTLPVLGVAADQLRDIVESDGFYVTVRYVDVGGGRRSATVIGAKARSTQHTLEILSQEFFDCGDTWELTSDMFPDGQSFVSYES